MLDKIIGAVGSIVAGAMAGDSSTRMKEKTRGKTKSTSTTTSNLGQMVRQAKRYGFNPLTVLRAGGLGAYASTSSKTKSSSTSRGRNVTSSNAPLAAGIASAAQQIGSGIADAFTPQAATARDAWSDTSAGGYGISDPANDYRLVQAQLAGSNWSQGGAVINTPASNERSYSPALQDKGKFYDEKDLDPYLPRPETYVPGVTPDSYDLSGIIPNLKPEYKGTEWVSPLSRNMAKNGYKVDANNLFSLEAAENVTGDDSPLNTLLGYVNTFNIVDQNKVQINKDVYDKTADVLSRIPGSAQKAGETLDSLNPYGQATRDAIKAGNPWQFGPGDDIPIVTMESQRHKQLFGDPALMSPTQYRQMMEELKGSY